MKERADREEKAGAEGETSQQLYAALPPGDPKSAASIGSASKYPAWSKMNNHCGYSGKPCHLQALPPSSESLRGADSASAKAGNAMWHGSNPGPREARGSFANGNVPCPFHPIFGYPVAGSIWSLQTTAMEKKGNRVPTFLLL